MECLCEKFVDTTASHIICIGNLWFFQDMEVSEREALVQQAERQHFPSGQIIFNQGDPADRLFIIKAGRIRLWKATEEGNEITLDIRQSGDILGECMFSCDTYYPVNATCLSETYTCSLSKAGFEELVLANPNMGLQVIKNLSKRIDWLTSRVGDMSYSNLGERLYRVLLTVAQEHGMKSGKEIIIPIHLTHEDLAFLAGAHRVSITRAMKELLKSGQVVRKGKHLIIHLAA
jgi:CRP-like cAMP-binding protein